MPSVSSQTLRESKRAKRESHPELPSPTSQLTHKLRKRARREDDQDPENLRQKRSKVSPTGDLVGVDCTASAETEPIAYWSKHANWPPNFANMISRMSNSLPLKRTQSSSSRSYSHHHESKMRAAGLFLDVGSANIDSESRKICEKFLEAKDRHPDEPQFEKNRFRQTVAKARLRTEARVVRDITPLIIPSPELLCIDGHLGYEHICESMSAEWTQCTVLCGPKPKPDFVAGIASTALTADEKLLLQLHHTPDCPSLFPDDMYYPFLICEVKSGSASIEEAERQAMHSASIAANAIVQLYKKQGQEQDLNGELLTISVCHNHTTVAIHGHYVRIDDGNTKFYRHCILVTNFSADLAENDDRWCLAYRIVNGIYKQFFPMHLDRIKRILHNLRPDLLESSNSQLGFEGDSGSLEFIDGVDGASTSQNDNVFKRPSLPASSTRGRREDMMVRELLERQLAQQKEEHEKAMERRLAQQKEMIESQQKETTERLLAQQNETMARLLAQQKETTERLLAQQKEMIESQQKETTERQLAQQKEDQREIIERLLAQQKEMMESQQKKLTARLLAQQNNGGIPAGTDLDRLLQR